MNNEPDKWRPSGALPTPSTRGGVLSPINAGLSGSFVEKAQVSQISLALKFRKCLPARHIRSLAPRCK